MTYLFLITDLIIVSAVIINCVVITGNKGKKPHENSHDSKELIRDLAFKSS